MSEENLEYILNTCIELHNKKTVKLFNIILSGGEPLLNFEVLSKVLSYYIKNYFHILRFYITTNGILFTEKIIEWFRQYNFAPSISLDSLKYSKPLNGISSHEIQMENIKKFKNIGLKSGSITVYHSQTDEEMLEMAKFAVKNLWRWSINLHKPIIHTKEQILNMLKPVLKYLYENNYYKDDTFYVDGWNLWEKKCRDSCPCGRTLLSILPDLEVSSHNEYPYTFLGKWNGDIESFLNHPNNAYYKNDIRPDICNDCDFKNNCDGGCRLSHQNPKTLKERCEALIELMDYCEKELNYKNDILGDYDNINNTYNLNIIYSNDNEKTFIEIREMIKDITHDSIININNNISIDKYFLEFIDYCKNYKKIIIKSNNCKLSNDVKKLLKNYNNLELNE